MIEETAYLRDDRYCSVHGIDLVPPDQTLRTRRYCNQCPPGSALGYPAWMVDDDVPDDPVAAAVNAVTSIWREALESGKQVPLRNRWRELAVALDKLVDVEEVS